MNGVAELVTHTRGVNNSSVVMCVILARRSLFYVHVFVIIHTYTFLAWRSTVFINRSKELFRGGHFGRTRSHPARWSAPKCFVMRSADKSPSASGGAASSASRRPQCSSTGWRSGCSSTKTVMGKCSLKTHRELV
jgi:hypothetical protein